MATSSAPEFPYPGGTPGDEPADPVAGKPGHFAWSRWIKQFVKNLDTSLMAHQAAADPHPQYVTTAELPAAISRVTHPNTDDVLVEVWDAPRAKWQRVHYDSGWRNLTPANGLANWTAGSIFLRRENDRVMLFMAGVKVNALTEFCVLPVGFQDYWSLPIMGAREGVQTGMLMQLSIGRSVGGYWWSQPGYTFDPSHNFSGEGTWMTADLIPSSLPGTLALGAPSLRSAEEG